MGQFCTQFKPSSLMPCRILALEIGRAMITLTMNEMTSNLKGRHKNGFEQLIIFKNVFCSQFEGYKSLAEPQESSYILVLVFIVRVTSLLQCPFFCKLFSALLDTQKRSNQVELKHKFTIRGVGSHALVKLYLRAQKINIFIHSLQHLFNKVACKMV